MAGNASEDDTLKPWNYVVWKDRWERVNGAKVEFTLQAIKGLSREWELNDGLSLLSRWPDSVEFTGNIDWPENESLPDNVANIDMIQIVSPKAASVLRSCEVTNVEYLPVKLRIASGAVLTHDYVIVHPVGPMDCLDVEKCLPRKKRGPDLGRVKKLRFKEELVVQPRTLSVDRAMFRPLGLHRVTFLSRHVSSELDRATCTGFRWQEIVDYPHNGASA